MNHYKRTQPIKPLGQKEELTNQEAQILKGLMEHPLGYLRKYATLMNRENYAYRFQDEQMRPIANFNRTIIYKLVEKNYLKLLPEFKFKLL